MSLSHEDLFIAEMCLAASSMTTTGNDPTMITIKLHDGDPRRGYIFRTLRAPGSNPFPLRALFRQAQDVFGDLL